MNESKFCCWLNEDELILSFHPVVGFLLKEFDGHDDMMEFVLRATGVEHYRVQ